VFDTTLRIINQLDDWVNEQASIVLPLVKKPGPENSFFWRYREEDALGLLIAKAVRIASGFRAAIILVQARHVTEAQSLLRLLGDFAAEIVAIGEGIARGNLTSSQSKFVRQFYADLPSSPEEYAAREREFFVTRGDLFKAHKRLLAITDIDVDEYERLKRFIEKNYDSYVHGSYDTAMELFHGGTRRFQTKGHTSEIFICMAMTSLAGRLYEALVALEFIARLQANEVLAEAIHVAGQDLMKSGEFMSDYCDGEEAKAPSVV
jgi:hypothetical protein